MRIANDELLSMGITSVQDASSHNSIEQWEMFRRWKEKGFLKPRVRMMLGTRSFSAHMKQDFEPKWMKASFAPAG